jgi:hypothetical protein
MPGLPMTCTATAAHHPAVRWACDSFGTTAGTTAPLSDSLPGPQNAESPLGKRAFA